MSRPDSKGEIDVWLRAELEPVARRLRSRRAHRRHASGWGLVALAMLVALALCVALNAQANVTLVVLAGMAVAGGIALFTLPFRKTGEYEEAARWIERAHPEIRQALTTAIEQRPQDGGAYTFLQKRVVKDAIAHARLHDWDRVRTPHERAPLFAHMGAFLAVVAVFALALSLPRAPGGRILIRQEMHVDVAPGDSEVERGSLVVVTARFTGALPDGATLVWSRAGAGEQRASMARSLSDPVFASSLPPASGDVIYRVEYDGRSSDSFHLSVYDLPALVQADATLDYPEYTGLATKRIKDTRRVSAVEGTAVDYEFLTNKPVRRAVLRTASGEELALEPANAERTRLAARFPLDRSMRYALHLEDDAGRANVWPDDIRLEALPNKPPQLRVAFPRGDQRVSPLEEINLEAEATDDFGLLDYGIGIAVGDGEPELVSLRNGSERVFSSSFQQMLALESRGANPDDLVTWFAWALDHGPDGGERRTSSDLFFGEVRPFDEIFREQADGQQQNQRGQQGGGQAGDELLETQRQISLALWKLQQDSKPGDAFKSDIQTLAEAQLQARQQLEVIRGRIEDEREKAAAGIASKHMGEALDALESIAAESTSGLDSAWRSSQGAYQALLRMQPREARVSQSRSGQGGGNNRNQRQLNQLRFRSSDDAYETESEAQAMTSPEEREQLQTLSRLRELARRQQDLNQRLQELQTALTAARDDEERERIERELKRLEEEQRRMLADLDEVRQRLDRRSPDQSTRQAQQQLEQTREDMRRSSEALRDRSVSEALASGTRARETLDEVRDDLRRQSSSRFAENLREARREARELVEQQREISRELNDAGESRQQQLDDSTLRENLAERLEQNQERLGSLMENLRRVTEESDGAEPGLHQQLYDLLRQQGQGVADERLKGSAEFLRRGFLTQAQEMQPEIQRELEQLQRGIERAAESVLGDEISTMRFAQNELDDLSNALNRERGGEQSGDGGSPEPGGMQQGEVAESGERGRQRLDDSESEPGQGSGQGDQDPPPRTATANSDSSIPGEEKGGRQGRSGQQSREGPQRETQVATNPRGRSGGAGGRETGGASGGQDELSQALGELIEGEGGSGGGGGRERSGPLTGGNFTDWSERLRTVESLLELPGARERLTGAREQAEELRREFRRHGTPPQWGVVEDGIAAPLNEVRAWLRQEIAKHEDPTALQPVDRDEVPEAYSDAVKRYYESLGR